jgi:hypothetical protein
MRRCRNEFDAVTFAGTRKMELAAREYPQNLPIDSSVEYGRKFGSSFR